MMIFYIRPKLTVSDLGGGVSTRSAHLLLPMERHLAAAAATSVGLCVSLTETLGTLGLKTIKNNFSKSVKVRKCFLRSVNATDQR